MAGSRAPRASSPIARGYRAFDEQGRLRAWFRLEAPAAPIVPFPADAVARAFMRTHAAAFGWHPTLVDLRHMRVLAGPGILSARFVQVHRELPVDPGEVVVNVDRAGRVHAVYSQYQHEVPATLDPAQARVDRLQAREVVARLLRRFADKELTARLIVYRQRSHDRPPVIRSRRPHPVRAAFVRTARRILDRHPRPRNGRYLLAWDVRVTTDRPLSRWRVLVDAVDGHVIDVRDEMAYAKGAGKVFDPNPIVTSGDPGLVTASSTARVNAERVAVALRRLHPRASDGAYRLDGAWVRMQELDPPPHAEPKSVSGRFVYGWRNRKFRDVMAYFHIDRFREYLRHDLQLETVADFSVRVDAHALCGEDLSMAAPDRIVFGEGGIPDATDAMVILHEYGHVVQDSINPGLATGNHQSGLSEGFPDFLAAVYYDDKHARPAVTRGRMFSWNDSAAGRAGSRRTYDRPDRFDGRAWADASAYDKGAIWCSAMFELYRKLGGDSAIAATRAAARDLAIRLHVSAHFGLPTEGATVTQAVQQLEAADTQLHGWRYPPGLHVKVIRDTFARRGAPGYARLPVDVYIDARRGGGYGSVSGDDAFDEILWLDTLDAGPDVWTSDAGGGNAAPAALQGGQPAHLHVRLRNRGTTNSGAVTVTAYRAAAPAPTWPRDFTALDAAMPSRVVPGVGAGASAVVGPFAWTPAARGSETIFVVADCAADPAVTAGLPAGAQVVCRDLVPFDNNLALRTLSIA
ncbi:MAG: M36 family metallopeptidase [Candidatus Rokubacteria bacterium]|nr:M36 family metallopeptidase [Candidatus Rokubacteria bacterium]